MVLFVLFVCSKIPSWLFPLTLGIGTFINLLVGSIDRAAVILKSVVSSMLKEPNSSCWPTLPEPREGNPVFK
jgi:hypothetical protein